MAWGFEVDCPECGHHWEAIVKSLWVGPAWDVAGDTQELFCRRCCYRVSLPRSVERFAWRQWYEHFLAESPFRGQWLLDLLANIDASLASSKWYNAHPISPGALRCPRCEVEMAPSSENLECPVCGSFAPVLAEFTCHVSMEVDENGFR